MPEREYRGAELEIDPDDAKAFMDLVARFDFGDDQ